MDHLNAFEVDSIRKKCHRVRSWYLYEQYKSLERNQLDAAQLLRSKSYQNNILRQELKERRARRRLCDQYGLCQSESTLDRCIRSYSSASTIDLFESLCELHEEHETDELKENCSCDSSQTSKCNEDCNQIENNINDLSESESIQSVIDNVTLEENLAQNVKEELQIVKKNIANNINLQLNTVKENIQYLGNFYKNNNKDGLYQDKRDTADLNDTKKVKNKTKNVFQHLFTMWSHLVEFAYNSIQINRGNCYCQCSSQLLTAVLACDLLRRGVDNMCNILQSYVSPIKYATSDSESSLRSDTLIGGECRRKKKDNYEKSYKFIESSKHCSCNRQRYKSNEFDRRCCSENKYNYSSDNRFNEQICRGASEPWRSTGKLGHDKKSGGRYSNNSHNLLKGTFSNKNICDRHRLKDIVNPILQVARHIENILQEIEETPVWL